VAHVLRMSPVCPRRRHYAAGVPYGCRAAAPASRFHRGPRSRRRSSRACLVPSCRINRYDRRGLRCGSDFRIGPSDLIRFGNRTYNATARFSVSNFCNQALASPAMGPSRATRRRSSCRNAARRWTRGTGTPCVRCPSQRNWFQSGSIRTFRLGSAGRAKGIKRESTPFSVPTSRLTRAESEDHPTRRDLKRTRGMSVY
jgi:hypothetical protein